MCVFVDPLGVAGVLQGEDVFIRRAYYFSLFAAGSSCTGAGAAEGACCAAIAAACLGEVCLCCGAVHGVCV